MSQSQLVIKKKILELESRFDVDKWIVNGIHIWPYIRIKIYFLLLNNYDLEPNDINRFKENPKKKTINRYLHLLKLLLKSTLEFFRLELFFLSLKNKKLVFFGSHTHRVKEGKHYFNRFFDSIVAHHKLENEVYMMEYQKVYENNYNQNAVIPLESLLEKFKLRIKLKALFQSRKSKYMLNNYQNFLSVLETEIDNSKTLKISIDNLVAWSTKIQNTAVFYKRFFSRVKPEKVIFLGYYAFDNLYAAIYAANVLQIKTIDFQHGTQSDVHMVFSSWTKIPEVGFNLMPQEYWSWDEKSKMYINSWTKTTLHTIVKVVGQPYLQYWKLKNSNLIPQDKVILYTLNLMSLEEMFNENIGKAINNSECRWEIRLHPRNEFNRDEIKTYLDTFDIDKNKYNIHDAKELPLPEIMCKAAIHLTAFSGSLIEAKMMGIPSVILDLLGKEIYKDYIDNELIYFIDKNSDSFNSDFLDIYDQVKGKNYIFENKDLINPVLM